MAAAKPRVRCVPRCRAASCSIRRSFAADVLPRGGGAASAITGVTGREDAVSVPWWAAFVARLRRGRILDLDVAELTCAVCLCCRVAHGW